MAIKRTYKIAEDTLQRFEQAIPPGQRSQTVERLMQETVDEIEREALRRNIIEGLDDMKEVYEETMRDWARVDNEGWPEY